MFITRVWTIGELPIRRIGICIEDKSGSSGIELYLELTQAEVIVHEIELLLPNERRTCASASQHSSNSETTSDAVELIGKALRTMAQVESDEARKELRKDARSYSLDDWKEALIFKVSAVGVLTGLPTGPVGLLLEGLDIAYLMAACGQACYGVGYIVRDDVDYDKDMPLILAIWSGGAETGATAVTGKVCLKVGGKFAAVGGVIAAKRSGQSY